MGMDKRVYGVLGISSIMANWNADFSGYPKTLSDGTIFGSDKALKYPMKKMWENEGRPVLYIKSMCLKEDAKKNEVNLIPRTLKERYEYLFKMEDLKKEKDSKKVLENLFQAVDVKNFGATFAEEGNNLSITGAVQIGQGFNRYADSESQEQDILSPFRDPKGKGSGDANEEAKNSTIGNKIFSDEAHYFYPFTINPETYKEYVEMGVTEGYTEEDYQLFKRAALSSATSFATNAKVGCENEFALFIETEKNLYLPNLSEYIHFSKGEKNTISIQCGDLLNDVMERILSIELFYNPYATNVDFVSASKKIKYFNIFTQKEE